MKWDLRTVDEILLEMELEGHQDFLVDGLIASDVNTILGDPFVGKTFFAIDVARSITTGEPLLGREVTKTVDRVAFLCTDPGAWRRIAKRVHRAGLDGRRIVAQQFYPPQTWDEWQDAVALFRKEHVGAIIVDNTTDLADDANSPREVKVITDGLRLWSDNGTTILNVHHLNKGHQGQGRGTFGSSMWRKWTRVELLLSKSRGRHRLETVSNDAEPLKLDLAFDPDGSPAYTLLADVSPDELAARRRERDTATLDRNARVAAWLASHPGLSQREAARRMTAELGFGVSQSRVRRVVRMSISAGQTT